MYKEWESTICVWIKVVGGGREKGVCADSIHTYSYKINIKTGFYCEEHCER